jgi:hypothetical protein
MLTLYENLHKITNEERKTLNLRGRAERQRSSNERDSIPK